MPSYVDQRNMCIIPGEIVSPYDLKLSWWLNSVKVSWTSIHIRLLNLKWTNVLRREMVLKLLVHSQFRHLMWLLAQESFIHMLIFTHRHLKHPEQSYLPIVACGLEWFRENSCLPPSAACIQAVCWHLPALSVWHSKGRTWLLQPYSTTHYLSVIWNWLKHWLWKSST
jgi:hypothetical protein